MESIIKILPIILILGSCKVEPPQKIEERKYLRWVGDIEFNSELDNEQFNLCNGDENVLQFFNVGNALEYEGEKSEIIKIFEKKYNPKKLKKESGLLRIRFIVNCLGETGRFRILGMDENYKEREFSKSITDQILSITKSLKGWKPKQSNGKPIDYYQYLIFKIEEGHITEILP